MKNITKHLFIISLVFFSSACSIAQSGYGTSSKKAIKLYEEARVCFANVDPRTGRRDLACAEDKLQAAIEKDANFVEALSLLSNVYVEKHDLINAIKTKKQVLATGKKFSQSEYFYLASMQMAIGDYEECKKNSNRYLQNRNGNQNMLDKCHRYVTNCTFAIEALKHPVPYKPINLGPNINTDRPEYFPSITADDATLLYTRLIIDPNAAHSGKQEDIFVATSPEAGHWTYGKPVSKNINSIYNEGAPTFSADGKYIILVGCETGMRGAYEYGEGRKGYGSCDLFVSERIGKNWTKPMNMGTKINSGHFESQPSFSSDGKTLYFIRGIIERGSMRNSKHQDIYVTEIGPDGQWTTPKKLGANVNSPYNEESVQIHPDGQTLYFASEGHEGMGGLDIFMSRLQPDGTWGKAINLGYPINTFNDENSLLVSSKGDIAYFASDREGGYGSLDLYQFEMPKKFQPIATTHMKGKVYDADTKAPLAAQFQLIDLKTNKVFKNAIANSGDGSFIVALPTNKDFALIAEHKGYLYYSKNYSLDKLTANKDGFLIDVPMDKVKVGTDIALENIFFDKSKFSLKPESITELEKLKDFLTKNATIKVELGGHTDSDGDDKSNQILSENRAKAVQDWLIKNGIKASRLTYKGYGETQPRVENDTPANKAKNRRTMLKIVG